MTRHPDLRHPRRHKRTFARFAMWFADWQGTPTFVAILTCLWIAELAWNQLIARGLGLGSLVFDPSTWLLNLSLSLLAAYASSLSVMGGKVQSAQMQKLLEENTALTRQVRVLSEEIHRATVRRGGGIGDRETGQTTSDATW